MTSIPADRTITLGNIVSPEKVDQLMQIAELQKPVDMANDRLNNLTLSSYKIEMILTQMTNMKVPSKTLIKLQDELNELKSATAEAAVDLAEVIIQSEKDIRQKREEHDQTKIGLSIESPINWGSSPVKTDLAISYDSLRFDVQYFSSLESDDRSSASSNQSAKSSSYQRSQSYVWNWFRGRGEAVDHATQHTSNSTRTTQTQERHTEIHGILVLVAECTHKNADIFAPCILDAKKAVTAWNYTFPDDKVNTDPKSIFEAAMNEENSEKKLHLLTGVTKSSSFVGYVNLLKEEAEKSTQISSAVASSYANSIKQNAWFSRMSSSLSSSRSRSSSSSELFATSRVSNSASLSVMGVIPTIIASEYMQVIRGLDPDPSKIMGQMSAVAEASSSATASGSASIDAAANDAGTKASFIELNSQHLENSVGAMVDKANVQNKVIDINTMMTAFENYIDQCIEGGCGIPTNYLVKKIPKHEVAKVYIRQFYPNGATTAKNARVGQMGQETTEGGS